MRIPRWALLLFIPILSSCAAHGEIGAPAPTGFTPVRVTAQDPASVPPADIPPGAAAAISDYFRLLNLALATGRTAELEESVAWDCPCLTPVPAIKEIYRDGRLIGARYSIKRLALVAKSSGAATIQVDSVRASAIWVIDSTGERKRLDARANSTDFLLEQAGDSWLIMSSKKP